MSVEIAFVLAFFATFAGYKLDRPAPAPDHRPVLTVTAGEFDADGAIEGRHLAPVRFPDFVGPPEYRESHRVSRGWGAAVAVPVREGWSLEAGYAGTEAESVREAMLDLSRIPPGHGFRERVETNRTEADLRFAHVAVRRSLARGRLTAVARLGGGWSRTDVRSTDPLAFVPGDPTVYHETTDHPFFLGGLDLGFRVFDRLEGVVDLRRIVQRCEGEGLCEEGTRTLHHSMLSAGLRVAPF